MGNLVKGVMTIAAAIIAAYVIALVNPIIYDMIGNTPSLQPGEDAQYDAGVSLESYRLVGGWMPGIILLGGIVGGVIQVARPDSREYSRRRF